MIKIIIPLDYKFWTIIHDNFLSNVSSSPLAMAEKKKTGALGAHATPVAPQRPLLAHRVGLAEGAWGNMVMLVDGLWWFMGIRIMLGSD